MIYSTVLNYLLISRCVCMNSKTVLELIGNTPLVEIRNLNPNPKVQLFVKLEKCNPGGSVKDRVAKYMIEQAEKSGQLTSGKTVIEPTSGNTGIGLALVCRAKGYDLVLVMPETMTLERRQILISLGAKIVLSDGAKGMNGAEDLAHEIVNKNPENYFMPNQFANQANVLAHYETTGEEIWRDTNGKITHFFGGNRNHRHAHGSFKAAQRAQLQRESHRRPTRGGYRNSRIEGFENSVRSRHLEQRTSRRSVLCES